MTVNITNVTKLNNTFFQIRSAESLYGDLRWSQPLLFIVYSLHQTASYIIILHWLHAMNTADIVTSKIHNFDTSKGVFFVCFTKDDILLIFSRYMLLFSRIDISEIKASDFKLSTSSTFPEIQYIQYKQIPGYYIPTFLARTTFLLSFCSYVKGKPRTGTAW